MSLLLLLRPSGGPATNAAAGTAAGTGAGVDAKAAVGAIATAGAATGAAVQPSTSSGANAIPGTAAATGAARAPGGAVRAGAGTATAVGAAQQPSVTTGSGVAIAGRGSETITGQSTDFVLTSTSFTPLAGALLIAVVSSVVSDPAAVFTPASTHAGTGAWTEVVDATLTPTGYRSQLHIFYAKAGASPGAGVITVTRTPAVTTYYLTDELGNVLTDELGNPLIAEPFDQTTVGSFFEASGENQVTPVPRADTTVAVSTTTVDTVLPSTPAASSLILTACLDVLAPDAPTQPAGYTSLDSVITTHGHRVAYKSGSGAATATWTSGSGTAMVAATIEIALAAVGTNASPGTAAGTGAAPQAAAKISARPTVGAATGVARAATVSLLARTNATAGAATAVGAALNATTNRAVGNPGTATAVGAAYNASPTHPSSGTPATATAVGAAYNAAPVTATSIITSPPHSASSIDLIELNGIAVQASSWQWDLLDSGFGKIAELHPEASEQISIRNSSTGAIKRRVTNFRLTPDDAAIVDTIAHRVRASMVLSDGSRWPLGVFAWADDSRLRTPRFDELDGTLVDLGAILGQPVSESISFPAGSLIFDMMSDVALLAGFPDALIETTTATIASPFNMPATDSTTYYKALSEMAKFAGFFDPYFDNLGRLRLRAIGDLATAAPTLRYAGGIKGRIVSDSVIISNNLLNAPNRYVVTDSSATDSPVVAIYNVPDSAPHSFAKRGYAVTTYVPVQGIGSVDAALLVAQSVARQDLDSYEDASWSAPIDPRHDTFDIVDLLDGTYLETDWTITLGGVMQHRGKRIKHAEVTTPGTGTGGSGGPTGGDTGGGGTVTSGEYEAELASLITVASGGGGGGGGTARFEFSGFQIINPDGQIMAPVGGNVAANILPGQPYLHNMPAKDGSGPVTAEGRSADVQNWGWNIIRVTVRANAYLTECVAAVIRLIDEYSPKKIIVMPECHDGTGGDWPAGDSRWANVASFWQQIIDARGTNPYLWANPANEPHTGTGAGWVSQATFLYNMIRSRPNGANTPIVMDAGGYGQGPSAADFSSFASGKTRVMYSWHNYGAAGGGTTAGYDAIHSALHAAGIPYMIGEFGWVWTGGSGASGYTLDRQGALWTMNTAMPNGVGAIWWHATGDDNQQTGYSLRVASNGATFIDYAYPFTEGGQIFWDRSRASHIFG